MGKDDKKSGGTLADQLADLDVDVRDDPAEPEEVSEADQDVGQQRSRAAGESVETGEPAETAEAGPTDAQPEEDPEEMFRRAVGELSGEDLQAQKFEDSGPVGRSAAEDGTMADDLEETDVAVQDRADPDEVLRQWEAEQEKSDEDRMQEALEGLSAAEIQKRKYGAGDGDDGFSEGMDSQELAEKKAQLDEKTRKEIEERRQKKQFESAMIDVKRNEGESKYKTPSMPDPDEYVDADEVTDTAADSLVTKRLPKTGDGLSWVAPLEGAQKQMKARWDAWSRRKSTPELNLRGETGKAAVTRLSDFVEQCWKEGRQFARIVHGRGKQSDGAPVLKPAVLKWLETHGAQYIRGYIPERQVSGDYGSLLVEFDITS